MEINAFNILGRFESGIFINVEYLIDTATQRAFQEFFNPKCRIKE